MRTTIIKSRKFNSSLGSDVEYVLTFINHSILNLGYMLVNFLGAEVSAHALTSVYQQFIIDLTSAKLKTLNKDFVECNGVNITPEVLYDKFLSKTRSGAFVSLAEYKEAFGSLFNVPFQTFLPESATGHGHGHKNSDTPLTSYTINKEPIENIETVTPAPTPAPAPISVSANKSRK